MRNVKYCSKEREPRNSCSATSPLAWSYVSHQQQRKMTECLSETQQGKTCNQWCPLASQCCCVHMFNWAEINVHHRFNLYIKYSSSLAPKYYMKSMPPKVNLTALTEGECAEMLLTEYLTTLGTVCFPAGKSSCLHLRPNISPSWIEQLRWDPCIQLKEVVHTGCVLVFKTDRRSSPEGSITSGEDLKTKF